LVNDYRNEQLQIIRFNRIMKHMADSFKMKQIIIITLFTSLFFFLPRNSFATNYYISPNGSSSGVGSSASPWKSFSKAWDALMPGDTLYMYDGIYTSNTTGLLRPDTRDGQQGKPITIKAVHDGQAIVDGQTTEIPIRIGENWGSNGRIGNWYVLEGIVGINGTISSFRTEHAEHIILRRVSAYNADPNLNSIVLSIIRSNDVLLEDCIAAGTGRYTINVYGDLENEPSGGQKLWGENNTVRRCFTMWRKWDGKSFCGVSWPNGNAIGLYNVSNSKVENSIAISRAMTGIFAQANDTSASSVGNQILGSIAVLQGRELDRSESNWGSYPNRPGPAVDPDTGGVCTNQVVPLPNGVDGSGWISYRMGFEMWGQGTVKGNVFRDLLAVDNAGVGVGMDGGSQGSDTKFDHITAAKNGEKARIEEKSDNGGNTNQINLSSITNSYIGNSSMKGEGARLQNRYVDGNLTSQSLWPWPLEDRVKTELAKYVGVQNFSVNANICQKYLANATVASHGYPMNVNCGTSGPIPTVIEPSNTPAPSGKPCPLTGDTNTCDGKIDVLDYNYLSTKFNSTDSKADLDGNGKVNVLDYTILSNNFGNRL
jgi:hypothetical protein